MTQHHKILMTLLAMAMVTLAGCSDESGDQAPKAEMDRAAEMQQLMRQTQEYARQEEERRQKLIDAEERPLIIGVVGPETGEQASYGLSVVNGVERGKNPFPNQFH